jgi:hypothetical protein
MIKEMRLSDVIQSCVVCAAFMSVINVGLAENIDPINDDSQYAYGENVGWLNFEPNSSDGVQVASERLTGYVWAENIGWISLSCENTSSCGTVPFGVTNDGSGNLSGYAWSENVGWISFSCDNTLSCSTVDYGVTIDASGNFDRWAWGENIGWIHLQSTSPVAYRVRACVVTFDDLANLATLWLQTGSGPADLDGEADNVDFEDYDIFSDYWQDFCPDGWQLK